MEEIILYGASDDLIEIESTAFGAEEFDVNFSEYLSDGASKLLLGVSDGSLFRVRYDEDGIWRFTPVVIGSAMVTIDHGQDDRRHSDRVTMVGDDLIWVMLGNHIAR